MSSLSLTLARENPWPGIAVASLAGVGLPLGITISALAWAHVLADREPAPVRHAANRRGSA